MKQIIILIAAIMFLTSCTQNAAVFHGNTEEKTSEGQAVNEVDISFDFTRMSTPASNQIAVWVEDEDGNVVKTIYVSDFAGIRRGYKKRKDAVSSATPEPGTQSFVWNLTDDNGNAVKDGTYTLKMEGTLFWSSNVLYSGTVDTAQDKPGDIEVQIVRSEPDNTENEDMISNVKITER